MTWRILDPSDDTKLLRCQPPQWEFAWSKSFATFAAGGWGSGKSYALLQWLAISAFCNPPWTTGMVLLPTYDLTNQFLETQLLPSFRPIIRHHSRGKRCLYLPGDRRLLYRSGHVPERIELVNLSYMGIDEAGLVESSLFYRAVARVRDQRAKLLRLGLVGVPVWGWLKEQFEGKDDAKRRIMHMRTEDNRFLHADAHQNLVDACPARLRGMYLDGQFCPPGGGVYPELEDARHVRPYRYHDDYETGCVIDWSPRTPHVLFIQMLPGGQARSHGLDVLDQAAIIYDELIPDGSQVAVTTERLCELIKAKGYRLDWACCDPAGKGVQATSGLDEIAIAQRMLGVRMKFTTSPRLRSIQTGIDHVKRMLEPLRGPPLLYFAEALKENRSPRAVLNAVRGYSYPQAKDGKPLSDTPMKDGIVDHACDCLRYLAINFFPVIRLQPAVRSLA